MLRPPLRGPLARLAAGSTVLWSIACSPAASRLSLLAPDGADYAVTATRLEGDAVGDIELTDLEQGPFELEADPSSQLLVAFVSRAQIAALVDGANFDLPIEPLSPPRDTDDRAAPVSWRSVGLPEASDYFDLPIDGGTLVPSADARTLLRRAVGLRVPYDPEHCHPNKTAVFAPLGAAVDDALFQDVLWLDDDHFVSRGVAKLIIRGRSPQVSHDLVAWDIIQAAGPIGIVINGFAFHRGPAETTIYAVGGEAQAKDEFGKTQPDVGPSWFATMTVSPAGFGPVHSATVSDVAMRQVAVFGDRVLMIDDVGRTFALDHPSRTPTHLTTLANITPEERVSRLRATPFAETPFITAVRGGVHRFDPAGMWLADPVNVPLASGLRPSAIQMIAGADGRPELWVGFTRGVLARRLGPEPWEDVNLVLPPRLTCLKTADISDDIVDMVIDESYVHVLTEDCPAVLHVRRTDRCTSSTPLVDDDFEAVGDGLAITTERDGRLLIHDRRTLAFYELDLAP